MLEWENTPLDEAYFANPKEWFRPGDKNGVIEYLKQKGAMTVSAKNM